MNDVLLPRSLDRNRRLDRWVEVRADGTVAIRTGKVDIGQGIGSALAQMAADELDVGYERIRTVAADTGRSPNEGVTAGSRSIEESGSSLRVACAEVRRLFLQAAARRLRMGLEQLSVQDGTVLDRLSNHSTSYWDLTGDVDLTQEATGLVPVKDARELRLTGQKLPRLDLPPKVFGAAFIHDMELPGLLFGRVLRPPSYTARLTAFAAEHVQAMPGVRVVVRQGRFLGVVAEREEQAVAAVARMRQEAAWSEQPNLPDMDAVPAFLLAQPHDTLVLSGTAEPPAGLEGGLAATYSRPFIAHASIGPCCGVAVWRGQRLEVWSHSQSIHPLRVDLSRVLGLDKEAITVTHVPGAGCYGHNGADDAALDAALLARAVPGSPVKLQWSREDEFGWDLFGPAMVVRMQGAVRDGRVAGWDHELWSNFHIMRPGHHPTPSLLAAWHVDETLEPPMPIDSLTGSGGASQRNAVPLYRFPNQRVVQRVLGRLPIRTSTLRGIGAFLNVFAIESFTDELAAEAGVDPVEFRLRHLADPRAVAVIEAAVVRAGWPGEEQPGRGMGLGFARYKNEGAYAAVVATVEVEEDVRIVRMVAAVDCGRVVNRDGLANQIEGGVVQSASWTLKERVAFDAMRVTSVNWEEYPIMRFTEAPPVDVHVIDRPDEEPLGSGEIVAGPTAAAIGNAVFRALGVRVRDLPITRERLIQAIGEAA